MLRKVWDKVRGTAVRLVSKAAGAVGAVALVVLAVFGQGSAKAEEAFTMPTMPIDFGEIANAGVTTLGEIAAGVAGVIVLSALIMMGFRWIKRAFAG